jgi:hypothetical protein
MGILRLRSPGVEHVLLLRHGGAATPAGRSARESAEQLDFIGPQRDVFLIFF